MLGLSEFQLILITLLAGITFAITVILLLVIRSIRIQSTRIVAEIKSQTKLLQIIASSTGLQSERQTNPALDTRILHGTYVFSDSRVVIGASPDHGLVMKINETEARQLVFEKDYCFGVKGLKDHSIEFRINLQGKPYLMIMKQPNSAYIGKRQ